MLNLEAGYTRIIGTVINGASYHEHKPLIAAHQFFRTMKRLAMPLESTGAYALLLTVRLITFGAMN
jgi:hypothetical protein